MKNKKSFFTILTAFVMVFALMLGVAGTGNVVNFASATTLPTITGVSLTSDTLSWDAVDGAGLYTVGADRTSTLPKHVEETSTSIASLFDGEEEGVYGCYIDAENDEGIIATWTGDVLWSGGHVTFLPELQDVKIEEDGVLSWSAYDGWTPLGVAWGVRVEVLYGETGDFFDGDYLNNNATSYNAYNLLRMGHEETGAYIVTVHAFAYDGVDISNSDYDYAFTQVASVNYNYVDTQTKLDAPTNLYVENGILHWDEVAGVSRYMVNLYEDGVKNSNATKTVNTNSCSYLNAYKNGHTYYFAVKALVGYSDSEFDMTHKSSDFATSENFSFATVSSFSNVAIDEEGKLTFDGFEGEGLTYHVYAYQNGVLKTYTYRNSLPFDMSNLSTLQGGQSYDILITVYGSNGVPQNEYTISNWTVGTTYTQPAAVANNNGGLSAGAVVAIVLVVLIVGGCGAFAIVWFVVKKKTWADFVGLFKKN